MVAIHRACAIGTILRYASHTIPILSPSYAFIPSSYFTFTCLPMHACVYEPSMFVVVYKHVFHIRHIIVNGVKIKHCVKFSILETLEVP